MKILRRGEGMVVDENQMSLRDEYRYMKPLATDAMLDLIELTLLAKHEPIAAQAIHECFEFAIPVLSIHVERDSAMVTGKPVIHFKLNETLMAHLSALRAKKREDADAVRVSIRQQS